MWAVALVAAEPCREQGQGRADALAPGRDHVAGELGDERHLALQPLEDEVVDRGEVVRHQLLDQRQRRRWRWPLAGGCCRAVPRRAPSFKRAPLRPSGWTACQRPRR